MNTTSGKDAPQHTSTVLVERERRVPTTRGQEVGTPPAASYQCRGIELVLVGGRSDVRLRRPPRHVGLGSREKSRGVSDNIKL